MTLKTVGEHLVELLELHGVDTVFGIPGVHTIELYRGLSSSKIRHITPRHEQGAGFMADGYARASGKPGIAIVITGPGLTNTITAMAQAKLDSVPILVVSGVNRADTLGKGLGFLHELPDQQGLAAKASLWSRTIRQPEELEPALVEAFSDFATRRPGPVHIEIPTDVMKMSAAETVGTLAMEAPKQPPAAPMKRAADMLSQSANPVIVAGGGARYAFAEIHALSEALDAPVVQTVNARGLMYKHALSVPASPSLKSVRRLLVQSDCVLAIGTEFGETDFDMYADGQFPLLRNLIRVDIDRRQILRRPHTIGLEGDSKTIAAALMNFVRRRASGSGPARAEETRRSAKYEIGPRMRAHLDVVKIIRDTLPGSLIVGDSTQAIYAANLYYDHDSLGGWFNSATGYGALGYATPASIGAKLGKPEAPVICLIGDGGLQFSLAELGSAKDAGTPVIFIVWNNNGYQEIESSMKDAGITPVGVKPSAPDFCMISASYGIASSKPANLGALSEALLQAAKAKRVHLIELGETIVEVNMQVFSSLASVSGNTTEPGTGFLTL